MDVWLELELFWIEYIIIIMQDVVGSSLLSILDQFALNIFPDTGNISAGNISEEYTCHY